MAPAGLVNLQAPLPSPPEYTLITTVPVEERTDTRWLGGAWTGGTTPGPAFTHDPCSTGTERAKMGPGQIATQTSAAFTVYLPGMCTAQGIGPDATWLTDKLRAAFAIYESAAVERVLATGDGHAVLGPYLGDDNLQILSPGFAVPPVQALGLLEQAIRRHGGGVIHAAPRTFTAWQSHQLLEEEDGVIYTALGTPIVVGYGYVGVVPDNGTPPTPAQEWAFASGPIEVIREQTIEMVPDTYSQALDRQLNDVLFIAERAYLLNWMARQDPNDFDHTQAGVLVDTTDFASTFIIVGSGASFTIETPSGVIDGLNDTFTLATTPAPPAALLLWKNGLFMTQGDDYTLAGTTITFSPAQIPPVGSILIAAVPS